MILVTTAGKVGAEAARQLVRDGQRVRVLVRDPDSDNARMLAHAGVEVANGDLAVARSIDSALRGVSTVLLVSPAVPEHELAVVKAAAAAGVGHVVKVTSKAGPDSPIARRRDQSTIENGLITSGLGYTLLRGNFYMQNFLLMAPSIAASDNIASVTGRGRIAMVDTRDVASVAAAIVRNPAAHAGQTYWLSGPESLSYAGAAQILSIVLGRQITHLELTVDEQVRAMVEAGVPEAIAAMNAQALALAANGDSDWVTSDVPDLLRRPAGNFSTFVADHAAAFLPT